MKTRHPPRRAPNPRRAELRALSEQIRPLVKAGMYPNVNAGIVAYYTAETGHADWRTFGAWREAGTPVRKGETGFPIWAAPRNMKPQEGAPMGDLQQVGALIGAEPQGPEFFPVCYLFHSGQIDSPENSPNLNLFQLTDEAAHAVPA